MLPRKPRILPQVLVSGGPTILHVLISGQFSREESEASIMARHRKDIRFSRTSMSCERCRGRKTKVS
jgi:hypothetical protein